MKSNYNFFYILIISLISGLAISSNIFIFWGITPNLLLVVVCLALYIGLNSWQSLLTFLVAFVFSAFEPSLGMEYLALLIISLAIIISARYISLDKIINMSLILVASTFLFYLSINYNFLIGHISLVILESILNITFFYLGIILIRLLKYV